jgi:hypothetical protein
MFNIAVGWKVQLGVVVRDKYGNPIPDFPVPVWAVVGDLATISEDGIFVAGTLVGSAVVSATVAGIVGTEEATLVADVPAVVEIVVGTPEPVV